MTRGSAMEKVLSGGRRRPTPRCGRSRPCRGGGYSARSRRGRRLVSPRPEHAKRESRHADSACQERVIDVVGVHGICHLPLHGLIVPLPRIVERRGHGVWENVFAPREKPSTMAFATSSGPFSATQGLGKHVGRAARATMARLGLRRFSARMRAETYRIISPSRLAALSITCVHGWPQLMRM